MTEHRMAFSLEMLSGARDAEQPVSVCARGHLVIRGRTHWSPVAFSPDLACIECVMVEREDCQ
jgi:hypothetical protein